MTKIAILPFLLFLFVASTASAQLVPEKSYRIEKFNRGNQGAKSPKRIYIKSFKMLFEVFEEATASTGGSKSTRGNETTFVSATKTRMGVQIKGVDVPDFQKIVDDAYAKFVQDLTAQGFEIISADEAGKTEFLANYTRKTGGEPSLAQLDGHVMVTPTGFEYFVKRETNKGKEKTTFTDGTGKLSKELGDAFVADVNFVFPFIELDRTESNLLNVSAVKGKVDYHLASQAADLKSVVPQFYPSGVKIQASWKISAPTFVSATGLKKNVHPTTEVFKDKKFKEMTVAARESFENAAYPQVVMTTGNVKADATHFAECDHSAYVGFASSVSHEVLEASIQNFMDLIGK